MKFTNVFVLLAVLLVVLAFVGFSFAEVKGTNHFALSLLLFLQPSKIQKNQ